MRTELAFGQASADAPAVRELLRSEQSSSYCLYGRGKTLRGSRCCLLCVFVRLVVGGEYLLLGKNLVQFFKKYHIPEKEHRIVISLLLFLFWAIF